MKPIHLPGRATLTLEGRFGVRAGALALPERDINRRLRRRAGRFPKLGIRRAVRIGQHPSQGLHSTRMRNLAQTGPFLETLRLRLGRQSPFHPTH